MISIKGHLRSFYTSHKKEKDKTHHTTLNNINLILIKTCGWSKHFLRNSFVVYVFTEEDS